MSEQEATLDEFVEEAEKSTADNIEEVTVGDLQQLENSPIESWELVKLGEILSLEYGDNLPSNSRESGDIPVYGSNGQVDTHSEAAVNKPGIILGRKGSIGEIEFSDTGFWPIDTTYYITEEETDENLRFLYYLLQNIQLERLNAASAIPGLNRNDTYGLNALIPTLSEQRKIASVLYTIDQAIQKTEELTNQAERVRRGLTQNLLNSGINDEPQVETNSRFGKLPESWRLLPLKEIGEIAGRTAPEKDESDCWGGDIPWATPSEITSLEGPTISETEEHLTEVALEKVSSNLLPPESILLTTRATIGKCAINTVEMTTNQGFKNLVPSDQIDTWYAYYRLEYESDFLASLSKGSTFPEVGKDTVENFVIPIPPIDEQKVIGERLKSIDDMILSYKSNIQQMNRLKQGLMQDLLSGKVRTTDADIKIPDEIAQHG